MRSVNQPDAVLPTMSKTPITASKPAAVTCGMPWSCAAGMKCDCTAPFVVHPQMKNVPARSQKSRTWIAWRRTLNGVANTPPVGRGGAGSGVSVRDP